MNNLTSIFKYFYSAALIISCCFIYGCENTEKEIEEWTQDKKMVDRVTKVVSYLSQEGKVKSKLTAPLMLMVQADTQYVEFPNTLHADFYDDSAKIESWLDARYGKYLQTYEKVYLRDSVVVISLNGDTLRCHDLWWDQNRGIFYTDSVATYHSPGNAITGGKGMEATQDFKNVTFKHPIGDLKISDTGFAE
ncbi:MAG: LPS export ABC transporter periplasmic protein LptC [Chitinophagaceae bacterium]